MVFLRVCGEKVILMFSSVYVVFIIFSQAKYVQGWASLRSKHLLRQILCHLQHRKVLDLLHNYTVAALWVRGTPKSVYHALGSSYPAA